MQLSPQAYSNMTDYLARLYDVALYTVQGMSHPVIFYPAQARQRNHVDSILGHIPSATLSKDDFTIYDYGYLHSLQNSQRHLFNGTTFALKQIRTKPLRIDAHFGTYYDMLATCYSMEQELIDSSDSKFIRLPLRSQLHRELSPKNSLSDGRGRSAAIGCVALIVFNDGEDYQAIISRRTKSHATRSDSYHLLPAFIFQPMSEAMRDSEWSIEHHFYREWLEELFGMAESDSMDFYQHPALVDLRQMQDNKQAGLYLTGMAMNLLTLRPEICMLTLIHDSGWWQRVNASGSPIKVAPSESRDELLLIPIAEDDNLFYALPDKTLTGFVPQAIPALWEGVTLAREIINNL
ncbi:MAG: hypothetical protein Q9P44_10600 [Anaerolineae bacterium]|nr:hypothetical protein [Anaerolineae bacterium]